MNSNRQINMIAADASVRELLGPILPLFKEKGVTEICINEPGYAFVECKSKWEEIEYPSLDYAQCLSLGIAIASYTDQDLSPENPILSATLPEGERIQVVMPPACSRETISFTIRVPDYTNMNMDQYEDGGMFERVSTKARGLTDHDKELKDLLATGNCRVFFEKAVLYKKNIAIVGDTGSGKTTFMKALCQLIPTTDRLITIEDVRELFLPKHRNKVHLTYSTQGLAKIDPASLVKSTMRMKPDRVLPAELRGAEAFDFVDLLTTGHNGSITSFHAESERVAFERFALMCKKHPQANTYTHGELMRLLHMTIDVIAHIDRDGQVRSFSGIYFDPEKKLGISQGQ